MKTQSPDTDPRAEKVLIEMIRKAPVWRRLEMVNDMVRNMPNLFNGRVKKPLPSGKWRN